MGSEMCIRDRSKRLPAVAHRAVWKKVTTVQPVRWDKEVEKVWQEIGGNKDEVLSIGESAGYKTKVRDMIETREKGALRCKSRQGKTSEDIRGVKRGDRDETIFAWPTGRGEKLETAILGGGPESAGKEKEMYE